MPRDGNNRSLIKKKKYTCIHTVEYYSAIKNNKLAIANNVDELGGYYAIRQRKTNHVYVEYFFNEKLVNIRKKKQMHRYRTS